MKRQINPVVAVVIVLVVLAAAVVWIIRGPARSYTAQVDTGLPPEVVKKFKSMPPQPMGPMPPAFGGGVGAAGAAAGGGPPRGK